MVDKKALLIGINYFNTSAELYGCINDVINIRNWLVDENGYEEKNITVLVDSQDAFTENFDVVVNRDSPTRDNILHWMNWLVKDATEGSQRFIHYSGHGSWRWDKEGDENDMKDETICPVDYATAGEIKDDLLKQVLVNSLPVGAHLNGVFDCCHSGTVLDLKYRWKITSKGRKYRYWFSSKKRIGKSKESPTRGNVSIFSGCQDNQTSADGWEERKSQGAMTYSFLRAHKELKKKNKPITQLALLRRISRILRVKNYTQVPQLSSTVASQPLHS